MAMRKRITSKDNPVYKDILRLSRKKYRDREQRYLIEGENLIREAAGCGAPVRSVLVREGSHFEDILPGEAFVIEQKLFDAAAQTVTSQGILAIVDKPSYEPEQIRGAVSGGKNMLVLDRLQDPGNIGTLIRTAEGAGYGLIACIRGTGDVYAPKVIRAAAGSIFRMPVIQIRDNEELRDITSRLEKKLVVTSLDAEQPYYEADLARDIALVIGNEGNGVSRELEGMADRKIIIPMEGRLESLNAAVAGGILMYEALRRQ